MLDVLEPVTWKRTQTVHRTQTAFPVFRGSPRVAAAQAQRVGQIMSTHAASPALASAAPCFSLAVPPLWAQGPVS